MKVAPHAGAWIETSPNCSTCDKKKSRPTRARGLKPFATPANLTAIIVAPHAGAWIET